MARKTEEEIFQIANELYSKTSKFPTIDEILEVRGRGSRSTIAPILQQWKEQRLAISSIPSSIRPLIEQFASSIWQASETEFKQQQSKQTQEYLAIKSEYQKLQDAFGGIEQSFKKLTDLLQESDKRNASLQEDLEFERSMHNQLKGEHKGLEQLIKQLKNELEDKGRVISTLLGKIANGGATP